VDADVTSVTEQSTLLVAKNAHRGLVIPPSSVSDQSCTARVNTCMSAMASEIKSARASESLQHPMHMYNK